MKRREFIAMTAAATVLPVIVQARSATYVPGLAIKELQAGNTVFLDFSATWCSTCKVQGRIIEAYQQENPSYEDNIKFIKVDWDEFGRGDLSNALKIPRRSTLVVLKGNRELGRIVAGTARGAIKQLMDIALDAAVA